MSQDLTRNLPDSFQERVLSELAAIRQESVQTNTRLTSLEDRMTSLAGGLSSLEDRMISFESRMTSLEDRMTSLEDRVLSIDSRLISLEDKVDARLRETRPIWEGVQHRLTDIEKGLGTLNRHFKTMIGESFGLRSRGEKLEDDQQAV